MINFHTPLEAFLHWEKTSPDKVFLKQHFDGKVQSLNFKESGNQVRRIARAIINKGLAPKSNIASTLEKL